MTRVFPILAVLAVAIVAIFPGLITPTTHAPVPCCGPTGSFQSTFALADSEIVHLGPVISEADARRIGTLEIRLDDLRQKLAIPGFSAAVVKGENVLWARGFGCADIATGTAATPHTPYRLASLTKPFGATVLLQLVEEGFVDLDTPIEDHGIFLDSWGTVRVKHLLSHTSQGTPGSRYRYHGDRFGLIDRVMEDVTGQRFKDLLTERIIVPLGLVDTLPTPTGNDRLAYVDGTADPARQDVWDRLAEPYYLVEGYGNVRDEYVAYFGSAAGLISSVMDYAAFSSALDRHELLSEEMLELSWTPFTSNRGRTLPYGYGWFVQKRGGLRIVWHYGYWRSTSTLVVKVPERGLTFLLFANSDRLSSPYNLGVDENVCRSPAARDFLDVFLDD